MDVISNFAARYERTREEEYSLEEYLDICKRDTTAIFIIFNLTYCIR